MQTIRVETKIAAPAERCFLLSLSVDLHMVSTAQTSERAIAGVTPFHASYRGLKPAAPPKLQNRNTKLFVYDFSR